MSFLISAASFLLVSFFAFSIPGIYILIRSKEKFLLTEKFFLGTTIGFVIFTLASFFLLIVKLEVLLIPIYLIFDLFAFPKVIKSFKAKRVHFEWKLLALLLIFGLGIIGQLLIIAPSGILQDGKLLFWSANGHDGMWHIALVEEIKKGWPLQNPVFAGEKLVNYHFFSDVAPAMFNKYFNFSNLDLYFRFFPLVYSILLGGVAYLLVKKMADEKAAMWATFFTYFGGSFGYFVTYLKNGTFGGESIFWATQIQSSSGNPPQIISNFLVLGYLYFFFLLSKKTNKTFFLIALAILASLALFKVYAALVILGPTLIVGVWQLIRERKPYFLSLGGISGVLAAALYLPNVALETSFLIFEPWWYIRTMIVEPSRLDWIDHELRRQTYIAESNWKRVIYLELQGLFIFIVGNLGTRIIGFWSFVSSLKKGFKNYFNLQFILIILLSVIFPLLFLQSGVASNTSQFLQYFVLLFGLLAGISANQLLEKLRPIPLKLVVAFSIIILSIPTQIGLIREFYSRSAFAKISKEELQALEFIRGNTNPNEILLTPPYNPYLNLGGSTPEIWDWFDTAYVSALTARRSYFDDFEQVDIMGYDFEERKAVKETIFLAQDNALVEKALTQVNADIIYYPKALSPKVNLENFGYTRIFENEKVEIWAL